MRRREVSVSSSSSFPTPWSSSIPLTHRIMYFLHERVNYTQPSKVRKSNGRHAPNGFVCIVLCPPLHLGPCQVFSRVSAIVVRDEQVSSAHNEYSEYPWMDSTIIGNRYWSNDSVIYVSSASLHYVDCNSMT